MRAKTARGFCPFVLEARDIGFAFCHPKPLAPASDIGGIGRAMCAPAGGGMIVPGPARGDINFETDFAAQAMACGWLAECNRFWFFDRRVVVWEHLDSLGTRVTLPPSSLRGALATKQSILPCRS